MARSTASARTAVTVPKSLDFDGTDDKINIGGATKFVALNTFTWEAWVNRDVAANAEMPFSNGSNRYLQITTASKFDADFATNATHAASASNITVTAGVWTHIALSYDNAGDRKIYFYKNGVETTYTTQTAGTGTLTNADAPFLLGNYSVGGWQFDGKITEVRVWNKQLNVADILAHYNSPHFVATANTAGCTYSDNCIVHYRMMEGTGIILADASLHGNGGVFKGSGEPAWNASIPTGLAERILPTARSAASARNAVA